MEKTSPNKPSAGVPERALRPLGRGALFGLLFFLGVTLVFTAGVLFIRFKLEDFRRQTVSQLEERLGAYLQMGTVSIHGVRGLQIDGFEAKVAGANGVSLTVKATVAFIHINLNNLLYGELTVDRVVLDASEIVVERPLDADWFDPGNDDLGEAFALLPTDAFRVTGTDCTLEVRNVVGDTRLRVERFAFDVSRPRDAVDLMAHLAGDLSGDPEKPISARLMLASFEDFDLRAEMANLTAADLNIFLPAEHHLVMAGVTGPTVWVNGRPGHTVIVSLDAPFEDLLIRDQPEFLGPASGTLSARATYAHDTHLLSVTTAKAESTDLAGMLEGTISFAGDYPAFDLRLNVTRLLVDRWLDYATDGRISGRAATVFTFDEPQEVIVALQGTSEAPVLKAQLTAASGEFLFTPTDEKLPEVMLRMGKMEGTWDSTTNALAANFAVTDGELFHPETGFSASKVSGTLIIDGQRIGMAPLNAEIAGNPFVGSFFYDASTDEGELTLNGSLADVENYTFASAVNDTSITGTIHLLQCKAVKRGDHYSVDAQIDATQAAFDFSWWFSKPADVASYGKVHVDLVPNRSAVILIEEADVASSKFNNAKATLTFDAGEDGGWLVQSAEVFSDQLDINTLAKCLNLPYKITGGTGKAGHFKWERDPDAPASWKQTLGCTLDDLRLLPDRENATSPIVFKEATVQVSLENGPEPKGSILLFAQSASMPSFGEPWFVSMRPNDASEEDLYRRRAWEYELKANEIEVPPWKGRNFKGLAYSNETTTGFHSYTVEIGEGRLEGDYHVRKAENAYSTSIKWTEVPAIYFTEHLHYPKVLTGAMSGRVAYSLDRDDPGTLEGEGYFEVSDGQFSADFLYSLLDGQVEDKLSALPPSLEFERLRADVGFHKDVVKTPVIELYSEGINLEGEGQFVRDGDMDYVIRLAVSPEMAEKIPLLRENLPVQGHRLANQDVELAFNIVGPTFDPQGRLAQLPPASVTLVSGGLEIASEAFRVIDMPRRILLDLLRIGGGIVGVGTSGNGR